MKEGTTSSFRMKKFEQKVEDTSVDIWSQLTTTPLLTFDFQSSS